MSVNINGLAADAATYEFPPEVVTHSPEFLAREAHEKQQAAAAEIYSLMPAAPTVKATVPMRVPQPLGPSGQPRPLGPPKVAVVVGQGSWWVRNKNTVMVVGTVAVLGGIGLYFATQTRAGQQAVASLAGFLGLGKPPRRRRKRSRARR